MFLVALSEYDQVLVESDNEVSKHLQKVSVLKKKKNFICPVLCFPSAFTNSHTQLHPID